MDTCRVSTDCPDTYNVAIINKSGATSSVSNGQPVYEGCTLNTGENSEVHIVTADDNEVTIPHYRFWTEKISNSTGGSKSLMCVANFYLHPDHDGQAVRKCLEEIAETSTYRHPDSKITVIAQEQPWGSHYKLKAYVHESREQFLFVTDLTIRGKESLREINIRFAQAIPAVNSGEK